MRWRKNLLHESLTAQRKRAPVLSPDALVLCVLRSIGAKRGSAVICRPNLRLFPFRGQPAPNNLPPYGAREREHMSWPTIKTRNTSFTIKAPHLTPPTILGFTRRFPGFIGVRYVDTKRTRPKENRFPPSIIHQMRCISARNGDLLLRRIR